MADLNHLQANLAQKQVLRGEADKRLRSLSQQAMGAKHDAFGVEQVNEKLGYVKEEIEALDVEIAQLEQEIASAAKS
jgi:prefoldin subunit 5